MTHHLMRRWPLLLLLSVVIPTVAPLAEQLQLAWRLRPLSMSARRESLMPEFFVAVEKLQEETPPNQRLALVGVSRASLDQAVFLNYYLYPHPTAIYRDRWEYLMADAKNRSKVLIRLGTAPRVTTYGELRNEELRGSRVVQDIRLPPEARSNFVLPIVSSTDGPPTISYTVEGALASDESANVTLTLHPGAIVKKLTIHGTRTFYDLVYQCFGVMEFAAWVQISSDRPVRAAFWLVNRAAHTAAPIRIIEGPLTRPAPLPVQPTAILWLLNMSDRYVYARAGPHDALVPPRSMISIPASGTVSGPVYAFLSQKESNGQTRFTWPEDLR